MRKVDFMKILEGMSRIVQAKIDWSENYLHPAGIGREVILRWSNPPGFKSFKTEYSFGVMLWILLDLISKNIRSENFIRNFSRYRNKIIKHLEDKKRWGWFLELKKIKMYNKSSI